MESIEKCECVIGMRYDWENTELVTLAELKEHIDFITDFAEDNPCFVGKVYTLSDYCDKRENTDLRRFEYCPYCGKKIDWKAIKGGARMDGDEE